ncbi:MAG: 50S ribosomal protein L4 [Candidatus Marinimicrobia bacterium]|nr:50S ribosomal protein L4 [Candidatus Neomarinimicrobiota bacterium]
MKLNVLKSDGSKADKQVDLKKEVFGIKPNEHAIYLAVNAERAHRRQGNASTKTRAEVVGSGVKLFRQKGTGRARVGDAASPIRSGGGRAFGPKPREYDLKINGKAKALARRSMLSVLQKNERLIVIEGFDFDEPKTSKMKSMVDTLGLAGKNLMVLAAQPNRELWLSGRNLRGITVKAAKDVSTFDLWSADFVVIDRAGIKDLNTALSA